VRTHYPRTVEDGMAVTAQEAWVERDSGVRVPSFVAEAVEEVAFQARDDARVDKHAGVSQRLPITLLEAVASNAERRAFASPGTTASTGAAGAAGPTALARVSDLYAGLTAITGKLELEYEGELKGGEAVAREAVRRAIGQTLTRRLGATPVEEITAWFDLDRSLRVPEGVGAEEVLGLYAEVPGLLGAARAVAEGDDADDLAVAAEFVLEGLVARRAIARSEERGYVAADPELAVGGAPRRRWN